MLEVIASLETWYLGSIAEPWSTIIYLKFGFLLYMMLHFEIIQMSLIHPISQDRCRTFLRMVRQCIINYSYPLHFWFRNCLTPHQIGCLFLINSIISIFVFGKFHYLIIILLHLFYFWKLKFVSKQHFWSMWHTLFLRDWIIVIHQVNSVVCQ